MAGIRKRASTKGDVVVEVKPGEEVVSVNVSWTVDKFVEEVKSKKAVGKKSPPNGKVKSPSPKKGAAKTSSPKGKKSAPAKAKKASKPVKKSAPKKKKK
jgi:hypothetical protein